MERDEALIISCRACLFFIVFWWLKKNIAFNFYLWFRIEEKIHTKAVSDDSRGEEFSKLSCPGKWGTNNSLGGKVCLGRARSLRKLCKLTIKWASSKTISDKSADTSCALPTGCFLGTIYWIALQKMHISEYVCKIVLRN